MCNCKVSNCLCKGIPFEFPNAPAPITIQSVVVNEEGDLITTLSNGTVLTQEGAVVIPPAFTYVPKVFPLLQIGYPTGTEDVNETFSFDVPTSILRKELNVADAEDSLGTRIQVNFEGTTSDGQEEIVVTFNGANVFSIPGSPFDGFAYLKADINIQEQNIGLISFFTFSGTITWNNLSSELPLVFSGSTPEIRRVYNVNAIATATVIAASSLNFSIIKGGGVTLYKRLAQITAYRF